MKKNTDKIIAKAIYNIIAFAYSAISGAIAAAIMVLGTHAVFPTVNFYTFLILIIVESIPAMCLIALGAHFGKRAIYNILCKIK